MSANTIAVAALQKQECSEDQEQRQKRSDQAAKSARRKLAESILPVWFPDAKWTCFEVSETQRLVVWETGDQDNRLRLALHQDGSVWFVTSPLTDYAVNQSCKRWTGEIVSSVADVGRCIRVEQERQNGNLCQNFHALRGPPSVI